MDTNILEDIGLTGSEIKVFICLLESGASPAGKIIEKSHLQSAVVHRAFRSLIEKGLITYILEGKIGIYQTVEPKLLLNYLDEKMGKLEKIIPELEARQVKQKEKPGAQIFHGIRGVKELLSLMLETNSKEYVSYGGPLKSNELLGEYFWENFHKKRTSKNIKARLLFHSSLKKWAKVLRKLSETKIKFTDSDFEEITETVICGGRVCIIVYLEKPYGFLIDDTIAARSYKKFFELLWKSTK